MVGLVCLRNWKCSKWKTHVLETNLLQIERKMFLEEQNTFLNEKCPKLNFEYKLLLILQIRQKMVKKGTKIQLSSNWQNCCFICPFYAFSCSSRPSLALYKFTMSCSPPWLCWGISWQKYELVSPFFAAVGPNTFDLL